MITTSSDPDSSLSGTCVTPEKLRILLVSNFFPPNIKGGAELACAHLAKWLAAQGHIVGVLTLAAPSSRDSDEKVSEALTIYRRRIPNVYHTFLHDRAAFWRKPLWHLIDHFNPFSSKVVKVVIRDFAPDIVNTHNLQGMGYNVWRVFGNAGVPVLATLHDPALVCIRSSMFRNGRTCPRLCLGCDISRRVKRSFLSRIQRLAFVSPSRSLLGILLPYFPANVFEASPIPNPLDFGRAEVVSTPGECLELLYVGQISEHKGVRFILDVLASFQDPKPFRLVLLGRGPLLAELQDKYAQSNWVKFEGFVPPEKVRGHMIRSSVLLIPSLWVENAPLVAMEAIGLGLPLLTSDQGGLPELVEQDVTGQTQPAGNALAWSQAIERIASRNAVLGQWRINALARRAEFTVDALGARYISLVRRLLHRNQA